MTKVKKQIIIFFCGLMLILSSCGDILIQDKFGLPVNAIPIVYNRFIFIKGTTDSVQGNYIFDTGASGLFLDSTFNAENKFGYIKYTTTRLFGVGNIAREVPVVNELVNFSFGKHVIKTHYVPIINLKPIAGDLADGMIGNVFFENYALEIDYLNEFIRIHGEIDSVYASTYYKIKLKKIENVFLLPIVIQIDDSLSIRGDFALDIGSIGSIDVSSPVAEKCKLDKCIVNKKIYTTKFGGLGEASKGCFFRAKSLQIGGFKLKDITMSYSYDSAGAMASEKFSGIIGNQILERFNILIDFRNNDLYLQPNAKYNEPYYFSRLGFSYVDQSKTMNAWCVTGMDENSNAERAGLKIDDKIVSVNGVKVNTISIESQKGFFNCIENVELRVLGRDSIRNIKFDLESGQ